MNTGTLSRRSRNNSASTERRKHRIVVLGEEGVGKSALTIQYVQNYFIEHHDPTLEEEYTRLTTVDEVPVTMSILDTAGQDEVAQLREQHVQQADGLLLVYSITDRRSFQRLHQFVSLIQRVRDYKQVPIVLVGNKLDLGEDARRRQVDEEEGRRLASTLGGGCSFVETSAKLRIGVDNAFAQVVREIRRLERDNVRKTPTATLVRRKSIRMIRSVSRRLKRTISRQH
eukprot:m.11495 g.11495  ORF g.11495 m.11495 type:complete len:228 (+) comp23431_c0_seq2:1453-2136(+)